MMQGFLVTVKDDYCTIGKISFNFMKEVFMKTPKFKYLAQANDLKDIYEHFPGYTDNHGRCIGFVPVVKNVKKLEINNYTDFLIVKDITMEKCMQLIERADYKYDGIQKVNEQAVQTTIPNVNKLWRVNCQGPKFHDNMTAVFLMPKKDAPDTYGASLRKTQGLRFGDQITLSSEQDAKALIKYLTKTYGSLPGWSFNIFHPKVGALTGIKLVKVKVPFGSGIAYKSER